MEGNVQGLGLPSLARQRWAGGGPPMPPYDLRVDCLIGGNRADQSLILAQFQIMGGDFPNRVLWIQNGLIITVAGDLPSEKWLDLAAQVTLTK
ncbi:MAG: hypothetical protein NZ699_09085 [Roseiflexus sp.]|nr:hypothetical protein [Roseiflexus sp.]MCS7289269.1 hypothetical protein [Roseiflexus sp.]MDW8148122.1 hypothetical protein [Roseiflexaceae bacterium]MDW8232471.1 hypothetical protein [Roseiflexaceae bacterium]